MRERTTVYERGRDHRQVHARALETGELTLEPAVVAQRHVRDGVHAPASVGGYRSAPTVPRSHVRGERTEILVERAFPEQTEVGEHNRLVDAHLGETIGTRRRIPVVPRQVVVVARFGRKPGADALAALTELAREAGMLHVDRAELAVRSPAEPRVAELVVDDAQRVVAVTRIDVVEPRRARLVEVLVGVDHGRHGSHCHLT